MRGLVALPSGPRFRPGIRRRARRRAAAIERLAGPGVTAGAIARLEHTVVAVDLVEQAVASARCIAAELPPGAIMVVQGDFYEIQLRNSFDVVCYFDGLGMSLLKLWVTLQPNAAEAYEMLG
jgi:hypothetical protein